MLFALNVNSGRCFCTCVFLYILKPLLHCTTKLLLYVYIIVFALMKALERVETALKW